MNREQGKGREQEAAKWLPVGEVAARLGISERAVQKRCASGKMAARRITTPQGGKWEVDARALEGTPLERTAQAELSGEYPNQAHPNARTEPSAQTGEPPELGSFDAQNRPNPQANTRTEPPEPANRTGELAPEQRSEQEGQLRDELARERELNGFLRGLIEGHQRSEAELRAALREALKAMPKQLPDAASEPATEHAPFERTAQARAPESKEPPESQTAATTPPRAPETNAAPVKEPRPLWKVMLGVR
jgi:hypothetical protein